MRSEVPFAATPAATPARSGANHGEATLAGGAQWLGVPSSERQRREYPFPCERVGHTAVLGSAHGPRLLELVRAAG